MLQTFIDSSILESSAIACCTHKDLQAPLAALLEAALSASANTMPQSIAAAVSQLGLALRGERQPSLLDCTRPHTVCLLSSTGPGCSAGKAEAHPVSQLRVRCGCRPAGGGGRRCAQVCGRCLGAAEEPGQAPGSCVRCALRSSAGRPGGLRVQAGQPAVWRAEPAQVCLPEAGPAPSLWLVQTGELQ